jgi:hypothetical protein
MPTDDETDEFSARTKPPVTGGYAPRMESRPGEHGYAPPSQRPHEEKGYRPPPAPSAELPPAPRDPGPADGPPVQD